MINIQNNIPEFYSDSGSEIERKEVSCILLNKLYLSNWRGAQDQNFVNNNNIKYIINLCSNEKPL